MRILAIETSCDETAAALLETKSGKFNLLSNVVSSQVKIHAKYGGIVPEVAARQQMRDILPIIQEALLVDGLNKRRTALDDKEIRNKKLEIKISNFQLPDYIAVTYGPGLVTSLRVGLETAKTLSYVWQKPLIPVNHLEGHIYASAISNFQFPISKKIPNPKSQIPNEFRMPEWEFPVLALVVSGGHTQLVLMKDHLKYKIVGHTLDDAAGEAFDKVAKILDLGYPGGPIISRLGKEGNPKAFDLPRPMINSGGFDFSFSGLKTAVLYLAQKESKSKNYELRKKDICASFQQAVVDVLVIKTIKAAERYKVKTILLGGGVSANKELREQLGMAIENNLSEISYHIPDISLTGDNAVMIAIAAYFRYKNKNFLKPNPQSKVWQRLNATPNLKLT